MTRAELRKSAALHTLVAMKIRTILVEIGEQETPSFTREDVQSEIVDPLHHLANYCERAAKFDGDQAELQSYDRDIEADATEERMA